MEGGLKGGERGGHGGGQGGREGEREGVKGAASSGWVLGGGRTCAGLCVGEGGAGVERLNECRRGGRKRGMRLED
jgi:hypothetical protein